MEAATVLPVLPAASPRVKAPAWAEVLECDDEELLAPRKVGRGQVSQITHEVEQSIEDPTRFEVAGKDKSWFIQKGGLMLDSKESSQFKLNATFFGNGARESLFGDDYAELSRADQAATINYLLMCGVAPKDYMLTGFKDCKAGGFYFLFHINYRRTAWRIIGCPHTCELEDTEGNFYTCDPQASNHFELPASEGQTLTVELSSDRELWVCENGRRLVRGIWEQEDGESEGKLPRDVEFRPVVLTPNCPTKVAVVVEPT